MCVEQFLSYMLDEKKLQTWIRDEWNKLYDSLFVELELLNPLLRFELMNFAIFSFINVYITKGINVSLYKLSNKYV